MISPASSLSRSAPRLRSEFRILRPGLLTAFAIPVLAAFAAVTGLLDWIMDPGGTRRMYGGRATPDYMELAMFLLAVRFAVTNFAAAAIVGAEFEDRTFERLLSEPVPRLRHWSLKIGALAAAFVAVVVADVGWILLAERMQVDPGCVIALPEIGAAPSAFAISKDARDRILVDLAIHGWALCATTTATLFTRRTYTGCVAGMLAPVVFLIALAWFWSFAGMQQSYGDGASGRPGDWANTMEGTFLVLQWFAMAPMLALGAWRMRTMEVAGAA